MNKAGDNNDEIMLTVMMKSFDENNNEEEQLSFKRYGESVPYVERHLEIGGDDFLIIPNGGSGDCMFKAVSQAVYQGNESKHREIRKRVVNFIISQRWEKFSESIEVQHINGNNLLQRQWAKDPKEAYKMYMCLAGTLGSISELTAAAELFQYNFATIQEYCNSTQTTYRVENCVMYDKKSTNFHYFYFTGDYDNGHWEYIKCLSDKKLADGTYQGCHRIVINGEEISFEDWLRRETENNNDAEQLKIATNHDLYVRRRRSHPFELKGFHFCRDGTVRLKGSSFTIASVQHSDLFSVLAHECLKNEASAHEIELILMKHRYSYFEDINYKLITQPWSHNFSVDTIRYCGQSLKGNIQDLIGAADLYSFSFILFLKMSDDEDTHQCQFTHVDRWGGESDRILYFFMRLSRQNEQFIAKWWRLIPVDCNSPNTSDAKLFSRKSISTFDEADSYITSNMGIPVHGKGSHFSTASVLEKVQDIFREPVLTQQHEVLRKTKSGESESNATSNANSVRSSRTYVASGRPLTTDSVGYEASLNQSSRPPSIQENDVRLDTASVLETVEDAFQITILEQEEEEPKYQVLEGGITVTRISDSDGSLETDECVRKDSENKIFRKSSSGLVHKSSMMTTKTTSKKSALFTRKGSNKGITNNNKNEESRPSTGMCISKDKYGTKIERKSNSGIDLRTYTESGSVKTKFTDLRRKFSSVIPESSPSFITRAKQSERSMDRLTYSSAVADTSNNNKAQYDGLPALRDVKISNNSNQKEQEDRRNDENDSSDVSFENFGSSSYYTAQAKAAAVLNDENKRRQISHGQQFPAPELLPGSTNCTTRSKTNKVAPNPIESRQGKRQDYEEKSSDDSSKNPETTFPCLNRLFQVFIAIIESIRQMTRKMKKGLIRRYQGHDYPPSIKKMTKKKKRFPHGRHRK